VCADRELLDEEGVSEVADALAGAQTQQVASAIARVWARHPSLRHAVVTGMGAFLGEAAAHAAGVPAVPLSADIGADGARCAPASAVALLLGLTDVRLVSGSHEKATPECTVEMPATGVGPQKGVVDLVIKIGGGLLADPVAFDAVLRVLGLQLSRRRALIVPGGGPFADAVRAVDRQLPLDDRVAHWMAVQAMDLYAELIASRLSGAIRVDGLESIRDACAAGRLPVLAPHRWLREVDPLPHSWAVTSDSIAAWIGRTLGARRLVLIKPPGARGERLTDDYFERAVSPDLSVVVIAADRMAELGSLLAGAANAADG
jgi:aspartokinase-like uncharacterized kinase